MEQFSLEKYLENPSRKVVTRDGRHVRILDYNLKGDKHICIAVDDETQESITTVDEDGHCLRDKTGWHESNFDLFFADEESTEFEKALLAAFNCVAGKAVTTIGTASFQEDVDEWSKPLLDLARKEVLKDLPKWKKMPNDESNDLIRMFTTRKGTLIQNCEYYISLDDLETLPKEE